MRTIQEKTNAEAFCPGRTFARDHTLPGGNTAVTLVTGAPRRAATHHVAPRAATIIDGACSEQELGEIVDYPAAVSDGTLTLTTGGGSNRQTKL